MRRTRLAIVGILCSALSWSVFVSRATAAENPPVLQETATVKGCDPAFPICLGSEHGHEYPTLDDGTQFKLNRRFLMRRTRYLDIQDDLSNALQRPDLLLINEEYGPFADETFETYDGDCASRPLGECYKIRDFPIAFGIHDLENKDPPPNEPKVSPHAFVYVPIRTKDDALAGIGDTFLLFVLHIPTDANQCKKSTVPFLNAHCMLTWRLNEAWQSRKYSRRDLRHLVDAEYRRFFDHFFDGFSGKAALKALDADFMNKAAALPTVLSTQLLGEVAKANKPNEPISSMTVLDPLLVTKLRIFLHNDIIHGTLR